MAGIVENPSPINDTVYESNLRYAVDKFKAEGIVGLIEPINSYSVPHYYMNCYDKGGFIGFHIIVLCLSS